MAFNLTCDDFRNSFLKDPSKLTRGGYLVQFQGIGMTDFLKPDIEAYAPWKPDQPEYTAMSFGDRGKVTVVGVIESFSWGGGAGHPISIRAYVSSTNFEQLKAKASKPLTTTGVTKLGWWLYNYDSENKAWFEECFPKNPANISANINRKGENSHWLVCDRDPTPISNDTVAYGFSFQVVPAANQLCEFTIAASSKVKQVYDWGVVMGSAPGVALPPAS